MSLALKAPVQKQKPLFCYCWNSSDNIEDSYCKGFSFFFFACELALWEWTVKQVLVFLGLDFQLGA
jgi:hypothetical protein